jgi:hypothetical protein
MKKDFVKSVITLSLVFALILFTGYQVFFGKDGSPMITAFLTITTSVVGFYIGYQTNKILSANNE